MNCFLSLYFCTVLFLCKPSLAISRNHELPYGIGNKWTIPLEKTIAETNGKSSNFPILDFISSNVMKCKCGSFSTLESGIEAWSEENITSLNVYPWSVSLVAPGGSHAFCGGSLINDRYVLTSASCVDGSNADGVEVLIGSWPKAHLSTSDEDILNTTALIRKSVIRVITHPEYSEETLDHNVALLRLKGPVPNFGHEIVPVCLPAEEDGIEQMQRFDGVGANSLLWRFDEYGGAIVPQHRTEIAWTVLSHDECRGLNYNEVWNNIPPTMMCARTEKPVKDHPFQDTFDCPGDAGGPLLYTKGDQKVQIGVDSWTACLGRPTGVGVFVRLTEYMDFIKLYITDDGRRCVY